MDNIRMAPMTFGYAPVPAVQPDWLSAALLIVQQRECETNMSRYGSCCKCGTHRWQDADPL